MYILLSSKASDKHKARMADLAERGQAVVDNSHILVGGVA